MCKSIIKLFPLVVFPFLLSSTHAKLTVEDRVKIDNNRDYYEVIEATTGKKKSSQYYAGDFEIKTHIEAVLAIEKALVEEGIDLSKVRIELYYDPLFIEDDLSPRIWNSKSHLNTVSSPWLDVTRTITTSGETRITIRIDATAARVIKDLFSKSKETDNTSSFLSINSINHSCFSWIIAQHAKERFEGGSDPDSLDCLPKQLRQPFTSLIKSTKTMIGSLGEPVIFKFIYDCQESARKYYSQLYPRLAVKALQILESESEGNPTWWKEVLDRVEPIQECNYKN